MKRNIVLGLLLICLMVAGCSLGGLRAPVAGLEPQPAETMSVWGIPGALTESGTGNSIRSVKSASLGAESALELAAGGQGQLIYSQVAPASSAIWARYRIQFLSTQGTGRLKIAALDSNGKPLASVGWAYTGPLPGGDAATKWQDVRYQANYVGDWLAMDQNPAAILAQEFPGLAGQVSSYQLTLEVGQGQHALVTLFRLEESGSGAANLQPVTEALTARLGDTLNVQANIENISRRPLETVTVVLTEPPGLGLVADNPVQTVAALQPGEKRRLTWSVKAQRPDAVNLGKPWQLSFTVDGAPVAGKVAVQVADPRPGQIFYVMTEDLEAIDSAGYPTAWGNGDGWLQPEELTVQMARKVEAIDQIADQYGAKWTHYIAWPLLRAAEWAAGQSKTGQWQPAVEDIRRTTVQEAARGHEFGIHMHTDYDPFLPGNVLSYNPANDGLWANHLRHGWAHSLPLEGAFDKYASKTGILYAYQRLLDELLVDSPQGQLLTARAGSFDFGYNEASQAMGTRAYRQVGLWGSSDADGNIGSITAGDFGKEIYLAKPQSINTPAEDLTQTGLVEFRPTPREFLNYDGQSTATMNAKADQGVAAFTAGGPIKPGVHAIIGFTHVMFMLGDGDWRSTQGGRFANLAGHLAYLKGKYVDSGVIRFATASELVRAYLDYYTPAPVAVYGPRSAEGWGTTDYPLVILGRDILIDADHPHRVTVKYPLYLRDTAYRVSVLKNGTPIFTTWNLPSPGNEIAFAVNDRQAAYTLRVYRCTPVARTFALIQHFKEKLTVLFKTEEKSK